MEATPPISTWDVQTKFWSSIHSNRRQNPEILASDPFDATNRLDNNVEGGGSSDSSKAEGAGLKADVTQLESVASGPFLCDEDAQVVPPEIDGTNEQPHILRVYGRNVTSPMDRIERAVNSRTVLVSQAPVLAHQAAHTSSSGSSASDKRLNSEGFHAQEPDLINFTDFLNSTGSHELSNASKIQPEKSSKCSESVIRAPRTAIDLAEGLHIDLDEWASTLLPFASDWSVYEDSTLQLSDGEFSELPKTRKRKKRKRMDMDEDFYVPRWPTPAPVDNLTAVSLKPLPMAPSLRPLPENDPLGLKHLTNSCVELSHFAARELRGKLLWLPYKVNLKCYPGLELDFERTLRVAALAQKTTRMRKPILWDSSLAVSQENAVICITESRWNSYDVTMQRDLFRLHTIHGLKAKRVMPGFRTWKDTSALAEYVALDTPRSVHDMQERLSSAQDINDRIYCATIRTFLEFRKINSTLGKRVLNCLDIPLRNSPVLPPCIQFGNHLASEFAKSFTWSTPWPESITSWALLSNAGAVSDAHIDASGFATFVHVVKGEKIWYIWKGPAYPDSSGINVNDGQWEATVLKEGNFLFMRPGTFHYVVTVSDCLAVGGHFYCPTTYSATLRAVVWEHYYGASIVNAEHDQSPIMLMKLLFHHAQERGIRLKGEDSEFLLQRNTVPTTCNSELAALATLVFYIDLLEPQRRLGGTHPSKLWRRTRRFKVDDFWAKMTVMELYRQASADLKSEFDRTLGQFLQFANELAKPPARRLPVRDFAMVLQRQDQEAEPT